MPLQNGTNSMHFYWCPHLPFYSATLGNASVGGSSWICTDGPVQQWNTCKSFCLLGWMAEATEGRVWWHLTWRGNVYHIQERDIRQTGNDWGEWVGVEFTKTLSCIFINVYTARNWLIGEERQPHCDPLETDCHLTYYTACCHQEHSLEQVSMDNTKLT